MNSSTSRPKQVRAKLCSFLGADLVDSAARLSKTQVAGVLDAAAIPRPAYNEYEMNMKPAATKAVVPKPAAKKEAAAKKAAVATKPTVAQMSAAAVPVVLGGSLSLVQRMARIEQVGCQHIVAVHSTASSKVWTIHDLVREITLDVECNCSWLLLSKVWCYRNCSVQS